MSNVSKYSDASAIRILSDIPIPIWMILITLKIGILAGFTSEQIISTFNSGWGQRCRGIRSDPSPVIHPRGGHQSTES